MKTTLDELIKRLEKVRAVHGGDLNVLVAKQPLTSGIVPTSTPLFVVDLWGDGPNKPPHTLVLGSKNDEWKDS